MGQLNIVTELSRLTSLVYICICLMNTFSSVNVIAQTVGNCHFETEKLDKTSTPWVIVGDTISEKTAPSIAIWKCNTRNIISSVSHYHPHAKYLTGHRFESRYEYRASSSFPDFVDAQKSKVILRLVTFGCENGTVDVRFEFPLADENDAPEFLQAPTKELSIAQGSRDVINKNDPIVVFDKDFDSAFNSVSVTTDRQDVLLVIPPTEEALPNGIGKKFHVTLTLNVTEGKVIQPGRYSLNLFANDGQWSASKALRIHVTPDPANL